MRPGRLEGVAWMWAAMSMWDPYLPGLEESAWMGPYERTAGWQWYWSVIGVRTQVCLFIAHGGTWHLSAVRGYRGTPGHLHTGRLTEGGMYRAVLRVMCRYASAPLV